MNLFITTEYCNSRLRIVIANIGSRDVIGHVTIRLPGVDFLWVVHSDHESIWHHYEDMAV